MRLSLLATTALLAAGPALAQSPLADAIEEDRRAAALELIGEGADVNAPQGDGTTALHWATYKLDIELVRALLDRKANPDAANRYGVTPLAEAVKAANVPLTELLLKAGANANAANGDGESVLMLAARANSVPIAKLLIDAGADVDAREAWRDQTALMWAADGANAELTKLLIASGADVRARAAANDWGAQITSEPRAQYRPTGGLTALLYAARSGCTECALAIVAAGEDIDRPTPDGTTALMVALDNYEFDTAKALLDAGANPHYADWWGRTALYLAVDLNTYVPRGPVHPRSKNAKGIDIVRQLIAAGVDVNPQLNFHRPGRGGNSARFTDYLLTTGATPLLRAAITHDHDSMRALLEAGASVDLPNVMGVTPLMAAAGIGVRNINFGANRSPDFEGDPTVQARAIQSIEILLAAGADINARVTDTKSRTARIARPSAITDGDGQTALFSAASRGWIDVTRFLVERGAKADVKDGMGRSPLDMALARTNGRVTAGSDTVAEILRGAAGSASSPKTL
jgi:ankyrin repeat protein